MTKFESVSIVKQVEDVARDIYSLVLEDENIAAHSQPGQFIMIQAGAFADPLLRRAISIARVKGNQYELLIQIVGKGTRLLRNAWEGQKVKVAGPLGTAFNLDASQGKRALLVAGGIGIAPMFLLADELVKRHIPVTLFYGARSEEYFVSMKDLDAMTRYVTEDGSKGSKGYVTGDLKKYIEENHLSNENTHIYACGPNPMLQALQKLTDQTRLDGDVSVETLMACGIGVCMGCPVELRNQPGTYLYACKDGPVFPINLINLTQTI